MSVRIIWVSERCDMSGPVFSGVFSVTEPKITVLKELGRYNPALSRCTVSYHCRLPPLALWTCQPVMATPASTDSRMLRGLLT